MSTATQDRPLGYEANGINVISEDERKGTPRALFWPWFAANISVLGVIDELEARLERPVVTSNQAVIWDALRLIGRRETRRCPGRLFGTNVAGAPARIAKSG